MVLKAKKEIPLTIPPQNEQIKQWLVFGLDPSVSRTGYALLEATPNPVAIDTQEKSTKADWLAVGSVKPDPVEGLHSRTTVWIRSKMIAMFLKEFLKTAIQTPGRGDFDTNLSRVGLIICMEYPTPRNDFLVALNRIFHSVVFEDDSLLRAFGEVRILTINASTLRSLMGLTQRGAKNKKENIERAYSFLNRNEYPQLDSDSCDAVMLAMMGRYVASILLGCPEELPEKTRISLCNATQEVKGKGTRERLVTKGVLHHLEYWYRYQPETRSVGVRDATIDKKSLERITFKI